MAVQNPNQPDSLANIGSTPTGTPTPGGQTYTDPSVQPNATPAATPQPTPTAAPSTTPPPTPAAAPSADTGDDGKPFIKRVQGHLLKILDSMGDKLGGPATTPNPGPHGEEVNADGTPRTTTNPMRDRVLGGVGKMMVGMSAGMGAARGPGGFGRAMSASSAAVMELQEKNKAYAMQMHAQHMQDFTAYRHQMADQADAMDKNYNDHTIYREALENSKTIVAGNGGQPMNWQDTQAWFKNMLDKKWGTSDIFQFAGPKEKNAPSKENPTGEGFHPTFFVFQAKNPSSATPDDKNAPHSDVTVDNSALAARLMVKEGSTVPAFMLAKAAGEDTALNNGLSAIKHSLMGPLGLKDADFPEIPKDAQDRAKDARAMMELIKEPDWVAGGDMVKAHDELQAKHPEMAATLDKYFIDPGNIHKASDIMRRASEKADEINKDSSKAPASPVYRDLMARDALASRWLSDEQKQVIADEIKKSPDLTEKQLAEMMVRFSAMDQTAMLAQKADEAKVQASKDASANRALEMKMKEGEEPTIEDGQPTIDAVGQGRMPQPLSWPRTPYGQKLMNAVNYQYPNYNATKFSAYQKLVDSFTAEKDANILVAINKVAAHLKLMHETMTEGSTGWTGRLAGNYEGVLGFHTDAGKRAKQLQPTTTAISTEFAKSYSGGVPTMNEISEWLKTVQSDSWGDNPKGINEKLGQGMELLRGAIHAESNKWVNGMPKHRDGTPVAPPIPLADEDFRTAYTAITGKQVDEWGNNPSETTDKTAPAIPKTPQGAALPPGTYVVVDGKYYDPNNPTIKAHIAAGWKPTYTTLK